MASDATDKILEKHPDARRDKLIPILQEIQETCGYLTEETIVKVGQHLHLPASKIYGIATFYNQFTFIPRGRYHLRICHGTSCHASGARALIREAEKLLKIAHGETTRDGMFSLEIVACMGACSRTPVIEINGEYFPLTDSSQLREILDRILQKENR